VTVVTECGEIRKEQLYGCGGKVKVSQRGSFNCFLVTTFRWRSRGTRIYPREEIVHATPAGVYAVVEGLGGR
jgi:hypothetical protein